ncbi:MAG TPA: ACT domain-containing protein [Lachnospiraceae bacterium]|nr:ACT domain-containing protein [Lachnospiraceae bacterium]
MKKAVITVLGKDTVGIIAKVCTYLADKKINILDISQTIVQDYFNMMMIVDVTNVGNEFDALSDDLKEIGKGIGVDIHCQREDIFEMMHRV